MSHGHFRFAVLLFFCLTLVQGFRSPAYANDPLEIVKAAVALYQPQIRQRFAGMEIHLDIYPDSGRPDAYANFQGPGESPRIRVFTSALKFYQDDEILAVICHEIGHFMGDTDKLGSFMGGLAYESEADYFSGSCMVRYLREREHMSEAAAKNYAENIITRKISHLNGSAIGPGPARGEAYAFGVNHDYADLSCRLLSVLSGVENLRRPACWYNPSP